MGAGREYSLFVVGRRGAKRRISDISDQISGSEEEEINAATWPGKRRSERTQRTPRSETQEPTRKSGPWGTRRDFESGWRCDIVFDSLGLGEFARWR
jgi:hypothetical protein